MSIKVATQFEALSSRLRTVCWLYSVGRVTELALPFQHRFVESATVAQQSLEHQSWEDWTLERSNDITSYLNKKFPSRDADWNAIARIAKSIVETDCSPAILQALSSVLPGSAMAADAIRWDLTGALMEAAYFDCRPPLFFTHLITVYEAGHLPVGWDGEKNGVLLIY